MKINYKKLLKRTIIAGLILTLIGTYFAHKFVQKHGFSGIGEFISVYRQNRALADLVEPELLEIEMDEEDYQFLKERRDKAVERGIQINDGDDNYVPCKLIQDDEEIKAEIRLKGHMTDHLEGDTWSFRVKTKKEELWGMNRFSLQKPGTRNYVYEWVYHELLKNEEVIYLKYDFIHLKLNEKDLGIYALEEHFGQHVLERNNRPNGAILRWNPNLYWEWRIDELQKTYLNEQYSSFSSSIVEPYEKGTVEKNENLTETYIKGAQKLEAFRRGEKSTSEIFDVEKLARFHAIIDLVGGHHSLDWSDVKFFYNAETDKIEPVGYESFSVRKTESIAGQRIPELYEQPEMNYHNRLFSDSIFFQKYIEELERIADENYLNEFITKIQKELDKKIGIVAHEYPYIKFSFEPYFENIELIRHNLSLPKPFHAFLENSSDSSVLISVTPVSDYPILIEELLIDDKSILRPKAKMVLPPKARNTYDHYFIVEFFGEFKKLKNLKIKARILGSKNYFETEVFDLPSFLHNQNQIIEYDANRNQELLGVIDDSIVFFKTNDVVISDTIFINENKCLKIFPGQKIHFEKHGALICYGNIDAFGMDDEDAMIVFTNHNQVNPILLYHSQFNGSNINFKNFNGSIKSFQSNIFLNDVSFSGNDQKIFDSNLSEIVLLNCIGGNVNSLGNFNRCLVRINNMSFAQGDTLFVSNASDIDIKSSQICNYKVLTFLNHNSNYNSWNSNYAGVELLAAINNGSNIHFNGGVFKNIIKGFIKQSDKLVLPGTVTYSFYKSSTEGIQKME